MLLDLGRPKLLGSESTGVREELLDVQALIIVCVRLALGLLSGLCSILPGSPNIITGSTLARVTNQATALLLFELLEELRVLALQEVAPICVHDKHLFADTVL